MKKIIYLLFIFIFMYQKGNAQWTVLKSGYPNLMLVDITTTPSGKIFAVGTVNTGTYVPLVLKSSNNGSSWDTIIVPPSGYFFQTIAFLNDSIGYIGVGGGAYILQTTDGGDSWTYVYQNPDGTTINDIEVIDSVTAVACGFGSSMYSSGAAYTLSNQVVWDTVQSFPTTTIDDMQMLNHNDGYALSLYENEIYKTSNGGHSWTALDTFPSPVDKMFWWNINSGIAVGFNANIYKTSDGGQHWTRDSIAGHSNELTAVVFFDTNNGYACAAGGKLFRTSNAGNSWTLEPTITTYNLYNMEIHGGAIYAVGDNGIILRHQNTVGVEAINNKIEVSVFPNPSNALFQISSSDPIENISLSDICGKVIFQTQPVNCKNYSIDSKQLSNGIYFLQVTSKSNQSCQKMVIQH